MTKLSYAFAGIFQQVESRSLSFLSAHWCQKLHLCCVLSTADVSVRTVWRSWWDGEPFACWKMSTPGAATFASRPSARETSNSGPTGAWGSKTSLPTTVPWSLWVYGVALCFSVTHKLHEPGFRVCPRWEVPVNRISWRQARPSIILNGTTQNVDVIDSHASSCGVIYSKFVRQE